MKSFKNFFKIKEYKNNLLETTIFNEKIKEIKSKINKGKNTTITLKDINYQNSSGNTFLHYCIKRNKYDIVSEYGYQLETETFDIFLMDDDDDFQIEKEESLELDQDELISFLNEYFTVNPDKIPTSSIF